MPLKEVSVHLAAMRRKDGGYQLNRLFGRQSAILSIDFTDLICSDVLLQLRNFLHSLAVGLRQCLKNKYCAKGEDVRKERYETIWNGMSSIGIASTWDI